MFTKAQLIADGCVWNRNMWIGDGWMYCRTCERYAYHVPMSHVGSSDCYECCLVCDTYTGKLPLEGSPMPVASDILASAKEFTERYAQQVMQPIRTHPAWPDSVSRQDGPTAIHERVFVLLQSHVVLGVISQERTALDEAHALMHAYGGAWHEMSPNRIWRSDNGVLIEVSAHDVR